jgi:hypothetical protein
MLNKFFGILILVLITTFLTGNLSFPVAEAQTSDCQPSCVQDYKPLTGIPGVTQGLNATERGTDSNLTDFFANMFYLGVGIAGILAVIMLMWGGIEYMTSEAVGSKENAKGRITNAVIGLIVVLMSWLILFTINPQILELKLNPQSSGSPQNVQTPGVGALPGDGGGGGFGSGPTSGGIGGGVTIPGN